MDTFNNLWTPDMATGIHMLDHELISIFADLNQLATASSQTAISIFLAFEERLKEHFTQQNELMITAEYPLREAHRLDHEQFLAELRQHVLDVQQGVSSFASVARLLQCDLRRHILAHDVPLGEAITQQVDTRDRRIPGQVKPPPTDLVFGVDERRLSEMQSVEWQPNLATGNSLMDDDHRYLINLYNDILLFAKGAQRSRMEERLIALAKEMEAHFCREEALMTGCPAELIAAHSDEHRQLLAELSCQIEEWHDQHISAAFLVRFLHQWLLRHIVVEDMSIAKVISGLR